MTFFFVLEQDFWPFEQRARQIPKNIKNNTKKYEKLDQIRVTKKWNRNTIQKEENCIHIINYGK